MATKLLRRYWLYKRTVNLLKRGAIRKAVNLEALNLDPETLRLRCFRRSIHKAPALIKVTKPSEED